MQTRTVKGGGFCGERLEADGMTRLLTPPAGGGLMFRSACAVRGMGASGERSLAPSHFNSNHLITCPVDVEMTFCFKVPSSTSKARKREMLVGMAKQSVK